MVPQETPSTNSGNRLTESEFGIAINGLIGGLVGLFLAMIPLAPLFGGGLAGYLEGGSSRDGLKAGAIAGGIMVIPYAFFLFILLFLLGFVTESLLFGVMVLFVVFISACYTIGLSVIGGYLGIYVRYEL